MYFTLCFFSRPLAALKPILTPALQRPTKMYDRLSMYCRFDSSAVEAPQA
jgi:hypothetical protein